MNTSAPTKIRPYERWLPVAIDFFLVISFFHISVQVARDVAAGGNGWKQGDWLINSINGDVRRGFSGDLFIYASDIFGTELLTLVAVTQVALLGLLFLAFRTLLRGINPSTTAILAISPAIFTVFWVADPQGSVRKELLTFLGLTVCALGIVRERDIFFAAGAFIVSIGFLAHEAMILFLPLMWALLALSWSSKKRSILKSILVVIVSFFSFYALHFALSNIQVPSSGMVCQPLMERGLDKRICDGTIAWLTYDRAQGQQAVLSNLSPASTAYFVLSYLAAMAPFFYLLMRCQKRPLALMFLIASAIPFLPLYFVAVDWGRWVSLHIFSVVLLTAVAFQIGKLRLTRDIDPVMLSVLITGALLVSPGHMIGMEMRGALERLISDRWIFLN
tara:strand:- start:23475 stop:24644 length:1170 start_codon:yes stop_codon:yes gene_type:complete